MRLLVPTSAEFCCELFYRCSDFPGILRRNPSISAVAAVALRAIGSEIRCQKRAENKPPCDISKAFELVLKVCIC